MKSNIGRFKEDIVRLIDGLNALINMPIVQGVEWGSWKQDSDIFNKEYYTWYSEAHVLVKQILPDQLAEFVELHNTRNSAYRDPNDVLYKYCGILNAVSNRFETSLYDIKHLAQADLFTNELDAARYLMQHKYYRAAGAISGVVLESYLKSICSKYSLIIPQNSGISQLKELLWDKNRIILVEQATNLLYLGQLRNKCDHDKSDEPTKNDIKNLISGTEMVMNTIV